MANVKQNSSFKYIYFVNYNNQFLFLYLFFSFSKILKVIVYCIEYYIVDLDNNIIWYIDNLEMM